MKLLRKLKNFKLNFYYLFSLLGVIIRTFFVYKIFNFIDIGFPILNIVIIVIANAIIEWPLYKFTFLEVGIFYKGGNRYFGSFLYCIFYSFNCFIGIIYLKSGFGMFANILFVSYIILILISRYFVKVKKTKSEKNEK